MSRKLLIIISSILLFVLVVVGAYSAWYTYHRHEVIAQLEKCDYVLTHPEASPKMRAPDGTMVPVMTPCLLTPVPPTLGELVRGHTAPSDVPERMQVNPYTFWDALLGRYSASPNIGAPCNQSATTTDCSTLPVSAQPEPQPYVPPNPVQPIEEWTSTMSTPIFFLGFSFMLPPGWHGSVYEYPYGGGTHTLVQRSADTRGFSIDCPPSGKGLEAATKLSTKERSFVSREATYAISFEEWTAPGNDPWIFVIARPLSDNPPTSACVAQGASTDPDIEEAMRTMYESWK